MCYAKVFPLASIRIGYKICHQCNGTYNWGIRHTNITNRGQWAFGCSDTCMHDTGYGLIWWQKHARGRKCCVVCKVCRCQDLPGSVSVKLSHLWWQVCHGMKCNATKKDLHNVRSSVEFWNSVEMRTRGGMNGVATSTLEWIFLGPSATITFNYYFHFFTFLTTILVPWVVGVYPWPGFYPFGAIRNYFNLFTV